MGEQLPGLAGEFEQIIGLEATVTLLKARGGTDFEIPTRASGSLLAEIIGERAAQKLIDDFGHGRVKLPCAHMRGQAARRASVDQMIREGKSACEIALACDVHIRTVHRRREELAGVDDRQQELPGFLDMLDRSGGAT